MYYGIDIFGKMAADAAVPVVQAKNWIVQRWLKLTKAEQLDTVQRDCYMLPVYRRQLVNFSEAIDRAASRGWDPEKVSAARRLIDEGSRELARLSNMVEVALADAKREKKIPDNFQPDLAGIDIKKVVSVGVTIAGIVAVIIVAGKLAAFAAAAAGLSAVLYALGSVVATATAFVMSLSLVSDDAIEFSNSAVWIVAIVAAAAGVWFLSSRSRRVAR